jgi:hypothetical protein
LLDEGKKRFAVYRAIEDARRRDTVAAQRRDDGGGFSSDGVDARQTASSCQSGDGVSH